MTREEKAKYIDDLAAELASNSVVYLTDTAELTVETINALRRRCFQSNIKLRVVKNALLEKAMERVEAKDFEGLKVTLKGSTSVMFSEVANAPAKLIQDFRKKNAKPILKGAYIDEAILVGDNKQLAISSNIIDYKKFDFIELTKIYRYDLMTKEIVDSVLKKGIVSNKLQKKDIKYCLENNIQILAPTHEDIKKINKIGLSMNIDKKVRFCKSVLKEDIYCGDMGIIVKNGILNLRNNIVYKLSVGSYDSDSLVKYAFALTYHSAQGMEFPKIACYYKKIDRKLLYVGFS
jgi:large subunit ribosomal protein L10